MIKAFLWIVYLNLFNHPTLSSSQQFLQFLELLSNLLSSLSDSNSQVFLFGDFNLDALNYNIIGQVTEYIDLLFSHGLLQINLKPTRCTMHSATLIDHVVTNSRADLFQTAILTSKISDHFPLIFLFNENTKLNNAKIIKYRNCTDEPS